MRCIHKNDILKKKLFHSNQKTKKRRLPRRVDDKWIISPQIAICFWQIPLLKLKELNNYVMENIYLVYINQFCEKFKCVICIRNSLSVNMSRMISTDIWIAQKSLFFIDFSDFFYKKFLTNILFYFTWKIALLWVLIFDIYTESYEL